MIYNAKAHELELSAHDHAEEPEVSWLEAIILTTDPYVPATIKKDPQMMTRILQDERSIHLRVGCSRPFFQLSYNHMQPMGWNDMNVPSRAPMRETRLAKLGIALAMT